MGVDILNLLVPTGLGSTCLWAACSQLLPPGGGFSICKTAQRCCSVYLLRGNQDPAPRLHCCFLTVPPLSLHPLPPLISNCLNLPFGSQGRSREAERSVFPVVKKWGTQKGFCAHEPHRVLLSSNTSSRPPAPYLHPTVEASLP